MHADAVIIILVLSVIVLDIYKIYIQSFTEEVQIFYHFIND